MQYTCRDFSYLKNQKFSLSKILGFLNENDIDILSLNENKSWYNENPIDNCFVVRETRGSRSHGSIFQQRRKTTIVEAEPEKFDRNERGKVFEIIKACFEVPVLGHFWVIVLYISPGCDLNLSKIFEIEMKIVFICGDFNASHQNLSCTYNIENCEKLLKTIKTGTSKLLNNGFYTYQSHQRERQYMFDLHFTDQTVFNFFDIF